MTVLFVSVCYTAAQNSVYCSINTLAHLWAFFWRVHNIVIFNVLQHFICWLHKYTTHNGGRVGHTYSNTHNYYDLFTVMEQLSTRSSQTHALGQVTYPEKHNIHVFTTGWSKTLFLTHTHTPTYPHPHHTPTHFTHNKTHTPMHSRPAHTTQQNTTRFQGDKNKNTQLTIAG